MRPRPAHLRVVKDGPGQWCVYVVVDDGRWKIHTEHTAAAARAFAVQRIRERQPREMEVTA